MHETIQIFIEAKINSKNYLKQLDANNSEHEL